MRQLFITILFTLLVTTGFSQQWISIRTAQPAAARTELLGSDISSSLIRFSVDGFYLNEVKTQRGPAFTVSVEGSTPLLRKGAPDLPKLTASVIIPDMAMMETEVVSSSYVDYPDLLIAPSKGNLTRDIDPSAVPFEFGRTYNEDKFYPAVQSGLRDPFILRDFRGQTVVVSPFAYNPVTKVLRVYKDITVRVFTKNNNGFNTLNRQGYPVKIDQEFSKLYSRQFLNTANLDYTPLPDYGRMLVISHASYINAIQPFVDWKNSMGIQTEVVDVATIGANATAIKNFVSSYYADNGLTFLLLVGDGPQIPTNTTGSLAGPSDNAYGYLAGNDHYPDIFVGRFSAENVEQVNTMVQRTLEYEKEPSLTSDWFSKGLGIGSDQGPGDDNEFDYQHIRNIRTMLMNFTYTGVAELYDGSQGGEDAAGNPSPANVATVVNAGTSLVNYTGHGSQTSWGTTGFSNTNVNALTNNHMWPVIWSVACVNGDFANGTCFAEAWLRAKNANGPTGAVATLMSTINQSWNPPMEGEDEMDAILVGTYPDNIKYTFGGLSMNGCYKMNDSYGSDGSDMTDTWTIFGDPSLMVRTAMPGQLTADHEDLIFLGTTSLQVSCDTEGALAGLSNDGQFIGAGFISGGSVTLSFPAFQAPDTVQLVVTGFNKLPYIVDIPVIPNDGPYLIYNGNMINDAGGNNNHRADYGESVTVNLALSNIGSLAASNVAVTLTSTDEFITITDAEETVTEVPAADTVSVMEGFAFTVHNNVPDKHGIPFHFVAASADGTWSGNFTVTAHAGILTYNGFSIDDASGNGNGLADPGETVDVKIAVRNTGTADISNAQGQISFNDPYLTLVSSNTMNYGDIESWHTNYSSFTVSVSPEAPQGYLVPTAFLMTADLGLLSSSTFNLVIGQMPVAVIDLDGNKNSGPAIRDALVANNVIPQYLTEFPASIDGYQTLFICLGIGAQKHELTMNEGQVLAGFLDNGGKIYMEGGDTWYYDPETAAHPKFRTNGVMDGNGDLTTEIGGSASFASGMSFTYDGDNEFIDHISPLTPAFMLFKNSSPLYITAVGLDAGTYRTIASSFEFGGIADGEYPNTKNEYMLRIIQFFGITITPADANFMATPTNTCENGTISFLNFSSGNITSYTWTFPGGNPATSSEMNPVVAYAEPGMYDVQLVISDGVTSDTLLKQDYIWVEYCTSLTGRQTEGLTISPNPARDYTDIRLEGVSGSFELLVTDMAGQSVFSRNFSGISGGFALDVSKLSPGVYTVKATGIEKSFTRKLIVK